MRNVLLAILMMAAIPAQGCNLEWDYPGDSGWLTGFRLYQDNTPTAEFSSELRTVTCEEGNLVPGPGPITLTAYRGEDESVHSENAVFDLTAPGVRVVIEVP